jgi:hypothetical protein
MYYAIWLGIHTPGFLNKYCCTDLGDCSCPALPLRQLLLLSAIGGRIITNLPDFGCLGGNKSQIDETCQPLHNYELLQSVSQ